MKQKLLDQSRRVINRTPRCGAKTRQGTPCKRKALANGRCPNHGGLSTGPKTQEGRARISKAMTERWAKYRAAKEFSKILD